MFIDANSLCALQIFETENHPNINATKGKEGLSLFNLLNFTKTSGGKRTLRSWLLRPLIEKKKIEGRYDVVEFLCNQENEPLLKTIGTKLRHVKDVQVTVIHCFNSKRKYLQIQLPR